MFTCKTCKGRGQVIQRVYAGFYELIPCYCKKSDKDKQENKIKNVNEQYKNFYNGGV